MPFNSEMDHDLIIVGMIAYAAEVKLKVRIFSDGKQPDLNVCIALKSRPL